MCVRTYYFLSSLRIDKQFTYYFEIVFQAAICIFKKIVNNIRIPDVRVLQTFDPTGKVDYHFGQFMGERDPHFQTAGTCIIPHTTLEREVEQISFYTF